MGDATDSHYVHGTDPREQERLSQLNVLLNTASLSAMALTGGERILDVGSGLGQFTRLMASAAGVSGSVVGVERNPEQRAAALRRLQATGNDGHGAPVEFRAGDARDLPLADDEWATFDVVHARFVLEHVTDPSAVVRGMLRAARPGGRIVLEDDDHDVLRLWPEPPGVLELWRAYYETYRRHGKDAAIGRRLVALLHQAGARPSANRCLNFGTCAGDPGFAAMIDNFAGVIDGARGEMLGFGLVTEAQLQSGFEALAEWRRDPAAALWYTTCWAEGRRPD